MTTVKATINQSIFDVCIQYYGSMSYMGKLLSDNTSYSYDSIIRVGDEFVIDEAVGVINVKEKIVNSSLTLTNSTLILPVSNNNLITETGEYIITEDNNYILID